MDLLKTIRFEQDLFLLRKNNRFLSSNERKIKNL